MQISNNFSTPNFTKLYIKGQIEDKITHLSLNKDTSKDFAKALTELELAAKDKHILLQTYGDGINVQEIDPKTEETVRYISRNNDFIEGMKEAAKKLVDGDKKAEPKAPRVRFPGKNTAQKLDTIG